MTTISYKQVQIEIAPGAQDKIARVGSHLQCLEASGPFDVSFDSGPRTEFFSGGGFTPEKLFQQIDVYNLSTTEPLNVTFAISLGNVTDARLNLTGVVLTREQIADNVNQGEVIRTTAGQSVLVPVNPNRTEIVVRLLSGCVSVVRQAGNTSGMGIPLEPGESYVLKTTAALWLECAGPFVVRFDEFEVTE
jgi:hypothetical protein